MLEELIRKLEEGETCFVSGTMLQRLKYDADHLKITTVARTGTQYHITAVRK